MDEPTEQEALAAWRKAIAATDAAERAHNVALDLDGNTHLTGDALDDAAWEECQTGRAYLAAQDRAVAAQVPWYFEDEEPGDALNT